MMIKTMTDSDDHDHDYDAIVTICGMNFEVCTSPKLLLRSTTNALSPIVTSDDDQNNDHEDQHVLNRGPSLRNDQRSPIVMY